MKKHLLHRKLILKPQKHVHFQQNRWSRGRSKERGRKSPGPGHTYDDDRDNSDYAADNSSDHSSSATPFESPRHRAATLTDSPLARPRHNETYTNNNNNSYKNDFSTSRITSTTAKIECEPSTSGYIPNQPYDLSNVSNFYGTLQKILWTQL